MSRGWHRHAACAGQGHLFFPAENEDQPTRDVRESRAKAICWPCPVRAQCREYALRRDERYGLWGGTTEADRAHIRRRRTYSEWQMNLLVPA